MTRTDATSSSGGTGDHGDLTGLADDDHAQYLLISGARSMTGNLNMGGGHVLNIAQTPLGSSYATSKSYVDNEIANISHNDLQNLAAGDAHTQYVYGAGRTGGQTVAGGANAGDSLTLQATSNATKGLIILEDKLSIDDSASRAPLSITERSAEPSAPVTEDVYLDDGTNTASGNPGWRRYTGAAWEDVGGGGVSDHGELDGLTDDDHTQYALLAGRSGGQTVKGGTASGDDLTLQSTNHATKGHIIVAGEQFRGDHFNTACQGRLTLTSGTAVTTADVTAATTVYFTPFQGNNVSLYNGTEWETYQFTELSLTVPSTTDTNYDVFLYDNAGTLTLEAVAWTNATTRATALVLQDGVYVKSGATGRRYLGSFRTTGVSGQTEDSVTKRYLWNYYNRDRRPLFKTEHTNQRYWAYATNTWRAASGDTGNKVEFVIGVSENPVRIVLSAGSDTASLTGLIAIGLDSTSAPAANTHYGLGSQVGGSTFEYDGYPGIGYHYLSWLEYGRTGANFYGTDTTNSLWKYGITGHING